ncbi:MAG: CRISPR-associated endonuclease Cas2 [Candidatus Omnitrophica bacterium]|nr:CRISPR-associated endonuclease Cas2 [Candidatus Omnitrophota bacterium]
MQLRRLHRRGLIFPIGKRGFSFVRLNKKLESIRGEFTNLKRRKYNQGWDKKWRILIYDIPEKYKIKREYLRKFLKNLGFGKVQNSCWVSPYDYSREVSLFSQEQKILNYICIYEGKFFAGKKIDLLVEDIWSLNELFNEY